MYDLTNTEYEAVKSLNAEYRQSHFLQKIKDNNEIYILVDDNGPFMLEDNDTNIENATTDKENMNVDSIVLPVFCHADYANLFKELQDNKDILKVQSITMKAWLQSWIPFLKKSSILLGIMPLDDKDFTVLEPDFSEVQE